MPSEVGEKSKRRLRGMGRVVCIDPQDGVSDRQSFEDGPIGVIDVMSSWKVEHARNWLL